MGRKSTWTPEDFWNRVIIRKGCWLWRGARTSRGYARAWDGRVKRLRPAQVMMWEFWHGKPFPEDKPRGLHTCDFPPCINPRHIFPGTQVDNYKDMLSKGRGKLGKRYGYK